MLINEEGIERIHTVLCTTQTETERSMYVSLLTLCNFGGGSNLIFHPGTILFCSFIGFCCFCKHTKSEAYYKYIQLTFRSLCHELFNPLKTNDWLYLKMLPCISCHVIHPAGTLNSPTPNVDRAVQTMGPLDG